MKHAINLQIIKTLQTKDIMTTNQKTPSKIEIWRMFDGISSTYDRINRILSLGMDQRWRKTLCKHLPQKENLSLLDLATGTADQIILALKKNKKLKKAVGLDLAKEMLEIGKKKLDTLSLSDRAKLIHASATDIPFSDSTFDAVSISFGIRNVENTMQALSEMQRILKVDGRALILEFSFPKNRILRFFHLLYLRHILPFIGGLISKNRTAYTYLNKTIETFPYGEKFCLLLKKANFTNVRAIPLLGGVVTLYLGDK